MVRVDSGDHKTRSRMGKPVSEYPKHGPTGPAEVVPHDVLEGPQAQVQDHTESTHGTGYDHDGVDFAARMGRRSVSDEEMDRVMGVGAGENPRIGKTSEERSKPGHTKGTGKSTPNLQQGL